MENLAQTQKALVFLELRRRFLNDSPTKAIRSFLNNIDDDALVNMTESDIVDILSFFEEVAIIVNSGVMSIEVAYYMFSYYIFKCVKFEKFKNEINCNKEYWHILKQFVSDLKDFKKLRNRSVCVAL